MPVDRRRWQPCSFGTLSESAQHAIPGCQASCHFKRDRTYHTRGTQLKLARKLVDSFVSGGTLSEALEQLYAADSDDFLKRLLVLVLCHCGPAAAHR